MPRTNLNVPFHEKDLAKGLGARWDTNSKTWYVPDGVDLQPFTNWLLQLPPKIHPFAKMAITTGNAIVSIDSDWPEDIFSPRRIASTSEIAEQFWREDRLFLCVPDRSLIPQLLAGGAKGDNGQAYVLRGQEIDFGILGPYLPFVGQEIIAPMLGDLIPITSFGSNLANLLTRSCWNILRQQTFQAKGMRCEICGSGQDLECHEYWEYHEPIPNTSNAEACGVQRLVKLLSLCPECHETHHLGLANIRGRSKIVKERLRLYNRWNYDELNEYCEFLDTRSSRRSQYDWVLDISLVARMPLVINDKWELQENGFYVCETHTGLTTTMIFGAPWSHRGNTYPALDPDLAYLE